MLEEEFKNKFDEAQKDLKRNFKNDEKQIRDSIISYIEENFEVDQDNLNIINDINAFFEFRKGEKKRNLLKNAGIEEDVVKEKDFKKCFLGLGN